MIKTLVSRIAIMGAALAVAFLGWAGWTAFSVHQTLGRYRPQVGDVLVQSIDPCGRLLRTVKGVTESKWCHCGVVDQQDGRWVVCEAVGDDYDDKSPAPFLRWLDILSEEAPLIRAWVQQRMARYVLETKEGKRKLARDFATPYAVVNASEDFADTFMLYLRKHESPDAYASRPGVHRKVLAVEAAVKRQALGLGTI